MRSYVALLLTFGLGCDGATGPQGEPGPQGPEGPQGSLGPQGLPGIASDRIRWVDATNTVIDRLYGTPNGSLVTYIDTNGIVWSASISQFGLQLGTTFNQQSFNSAPVWATANCSGTTYYTAMASSPARVAHSIDLRNEYRVLKDTAALPVQLATYSTEFVSGCVQLNGPIYATIETDTIVVTRPTINAVLPLHAEFVQ